MQTAGFILVTVVRVLAPMLAAGGYWVGLDGMLAGSEPCATFGRDAIARAFTLPQVTELPAAIS